MYTPFLIQPRRLRGMGNLEYDGMNAEVQALSTQITNLHLGTQAIVSRFGVDSARANALIDRIQTLGMQVDGFDNQDTFTRNDYIAAKNAFNILVGEFNELDRESMKSTALLGAGAVGVIALGAWFIWKKS